MLGIKTIEKSREILSTHDASVRRVEIEKMRGDGTCEARLTFEPFPLRPTPRLLEVKIEGRERWGIPQWDLPEVRDHVLVAKERVKTRMMARLLGKDLPIPLSSRSRTEMRFLRIITSHRNSGSLLSV